MSDLSRLLDDVYDPDAGGRFTAGEVTASPPPGDSPEAAARRAFDWRADEQLDASFDAWMSGSQASAPEAELQPAATATPPAAPPTPVAAPYPAPAASAVAATPVTPAPAPDPAYPPVPPVSAASFREAVQWPTEPISPPEAELAPQAPAWHPADDDILPTR
jgi:hypothetical protein